MKKILFITGSPGKASLNRCLVAGTEKTGRCVHGIS